METTKTNKNRPPGEIDDLPNRIVLQNSIGERKMHNDFRWNNNEKLDYCKLETGFGVRAADRSMSQSKRPSWESAGKLVNGDDGATANCHVFEASCAWLGPGQEVRGHDTRYPFYADQLTDCGQPDVGTHTLTPTPSNNVLRPLGSCKDSQWQNQREPFSSRSPRMSGKDVLITYVTPFIKPLAQLSLVSLLVSSYGVQDNKTRRVDTYMSIPGKRVYSTRVSSTLFQSKAQGKNCVPIRTDRADGS
ncbi:hypothetical protein ACJJTC_008566 [Scirpophaga incertulas]